jgi:nitrogen fixation protein NifU and related proteins
MKETKEFNFWNDHSRNFLEMAFRTDKQEIKHSSLHTGKNIGECGDMLEMYLDIDDKKKIKNVTYNIEGCRNTNACANTICFLIEGKHIDKAREITPQVIIDYLETLPHANHHCAELAVGALYKALDTIQALRKEN